MVGTCAAASLRVIVGTLRQSDVKRIACSGYSTATQQQVVGYADQLFEVLERADKAYDII